MKKLFLLLIIGFFIPTVGVSQTIDIQASPNVLNLQNKATVVTIHANIDFELVIGSSVTLNGLVIKSWKADDCGDFVAKFNMDDVKGLEGLLIGDYNTLTLTGLTAKGETFTGSTQIMVINIIPKK
ncbi:MAG: hypothetical protein V1783_09195 [Bacteroidota bacterium]